MSFGELLPSSSANVVSFRSTSPSTDLNLLPTGNVRLEQTSLRLLWVSWTLTEPEWRRLGQTDAPILPASSPFKATLVARDSTVVGRIVRAMHAGGGRQHV